MNIYKVTIRYAPGAVDAGEELITYTDTTRMPAETYAEAGSKVLALPKYDNAAERAIVSTVLVEGE